MKFLKNRMIKLAALVVALVAIGFFVFTFTYGCDATNGGVSTESDIVDVAPNDTEDVTPNDSAEADAPGMLDVEEPEDGLGDSDTDPTDSDAP